MHVFAEVIEEVTYTNNIDIITGTPKSGQDHNFVQLTFFSEKKNTQESISF